MGHSGGFGASGLRVSTVLWVILEGGAVSAAANSIRKVATRLEHIYAYVVKIGGRIRWVNFLNALNRKFRATAHNDTDWTA